MKRLLLLFAVLLASGLLAAGCGDDDDENGDDPPATTETTPSSEEDIDSVNTAVEYCKESVQATGNQLSEDVKSDLEDMCEEGANDAEALREANLEICRRFVAEAVPEGAGREQALEACGNAATP